MLLAKSMPIPPRWSWGVRVSDEIREGPALRVEVEGSPQGDGPWRTTFRIANEGSDPVELRAGWMPHIVYGADEVDLSRAPALGAREATEVSFDATYTPREDASEPSNPFLILQVRWQGEDWRVLVQLSVTGPACRAPDVGVAAVRVHRVGFSRGLA
jgi:hypothetical protein